MIGWSITVLVLTIIAIGASMVAARTERYRLATIAGSPGQ
jgi:hypothetical protein